MVYRFAAQRRRVFNTVLLKRLKTCKMKNRELKLQLLKEYYSRGIDFVREAFKFVTEDDEPAAIIQQYNVDGVYFVYQDGTNEPFTGQKAKDGCIGVGIVQGCRRLIVALNDMSEDDDLELTTGDDETNATEYYIKKPIEANADWNGKANTEHLKKIGLNPKIKLEDGWFIPSMAQMRLIHCNLLEVNKALVNAGGTPLDCEYKAWYWTSTEYSATRAWYLRLDTGNMGINTKASDQSRVRAVSEFIS